MGWAHGDKKGPVVVLSCHRARSARLRQLLEADRFEVLCCASSSEVDPVVATRMPTAIVLDWGADDEPGLQDLVHALRPRESGARLVVVADGPEAEVMRSSLAVRAVIGSVLDAEEVADAVWRAHHETVDARLGR